MQVDFLVRVLPHQGAALECHLHPPSVIALGIGVLVDGNILEGILSLGDEED